MDVALNQISDMNTRLIEMDRLRKQLEAEKLSLNSTIDEYREQLQIEISKYASLSASVEKLRLDYEKKIAEKEEELDVLRVSHRRQLDQMQTQIEELEVRYKTDMQRLKAKYQGEIEELRLQLDSLKRIRAELENHLKKLQVALKDAQDHLLEEQTLHETTRGLLNGVEKRNGKRRILHLHRDYRVFLSAILRGENEELRVFLDRVSFKTIALLFFSLIC